MKTIAIALLLAGICQAQNQGPGKVEGQVTSSTGGPLRNVTVRMQPARAATPPQGQATAGVSTTTTDDSGKFAFESVDPGRYFVSAQQTGYLRQRVLSVFTVSAGQPASVAIQLTPESRIEGRVTNQDGEPFHAGRVFVSQWGVMAGYFKVLRDLAVDGAAIAGDGTFVAGGLPAGHYYVSAGADPREVATEERKGKTISEAEVRTYFPGVASSSSANLIEVGPGAVVQGIEFRVVRSAVYSIQGTAIDSITGAPAANTQLAFLSTESATRRSVSTHPDGTFQVIDVIPGQYLVEAHPAPTRGAGAAQSPPVYSFGDQTITVGKQNVDGLVLRLSPGAEITGTISMEEGTQTLQSRQMLRNGFPPVSLASSGPFLVANSQAQSNSDGSFAIHDVGPGDYVPQFFNPPAGTYVKSMRYSQQDVMDKPIHIDSSAGGTLEIVLSPHAAQLTGVVRDSGGTPLPGVPVSLWKPGQASGSGFIYLTSGTGPAGTFSLSNLAPGEYRVAAWEGDGMLPIPEFLSQFESRAADVRLDRDARQNVDVPLIRADAIDNALDNLR